MLAEGSNLQFDIEAVAIPFHVRRNQRHYYTQSLCQAAAAPAIPQDIRGASGIEVTKQLD
jgi:hypothetical protein